MNGRTITFLIFIIFVMGSMIGFLAGTSFQKGLPKVAPEIKQFSDEEDRRAPSGDDTVEGLRHRVDELTQQQKRLNDRLSNYLDLKNNESAPIVKQHFEERKAVVQPVIAPAKTKEPKKPAEPQPQLAFYERANQHLMPLVIPASTLSKLFPNKEFDVKNFKNIGVQTEPLNDAAKFLKDHRCADASFSLMSDEQKNRSRFFDLVKEGSYKGETKIATGSLRKTLDTTVSFNSNKHSGFDYIATSDEQKNYLEKRMIDNDNDNDSWRFNSCAPSVVLPGDRCPWNDKFSQEFKDFYVSPDSRKLIGSIFCKNPADAKWTTVGTFELDQSATEVE